MPLWKLDDPIHIGKIIKPHSYLGLVRVAFLFPGLEEALQPGNFIFISWMEKPVPYRIETIHWETDTDARLKLEGIDSDAEALKLKGRELILPEAEIPAESLETEMEPGRELIGYGIRDIHNGQELGNVTDILDNGAQMLLDVTLRGATYMIPVVDELVRRIDRRKKLIYVDLPEGLAEI